MPTSGRVSSHPRTGSGDSASLDLTNSTAVAQARRMMLDQATRAGSFDDLQRDGRLLTKVGSVPVLVVWNDGRAFAIEDRCPHLGFPLHQGTVEAGLVTCHWHHARFDLVSGCTLDPWADDAIGFDVSIEDGAVL